MRAVPADITIQPATRADTEAIRAIGRELARDGTAYFFAPETTDEALEEYWLSPKGQTFVALTRGEVAGVYPPRVPAPEPRPRGRFRHVPGPVSASLVAAPRAIR
jgi:hypothetical protein